MNEHDVVRFFPAFPRGIVMTVPMQAASGQGGFTFLHSLFKASPCFSLQFLSLSLHTPSNGNATLSCGCEERL